MNFLQSFNNKTILIPLLQRDYVQGGSEDVIGPFLDALIEKECDLTYIYGYEENGCFVPVDGQQRLTTLWLLHLYLFAFKQRMNEFNVSMKFTSREFAQDFCECLYANIESLLKNKAIADFDKSIIDQSWFISSWLSNATVKNMLGTLRLLHQKITSQNLPKIWENVVNEDNSTITFAFLQMDEDNGLDDDIYIKMNGRGRKLSAFENLKSFMDEHVTNLTFSDSWKDKMDNVWTDLCWTNRNLSQEHPEEIDDEQLYLVYNLLILFHIRHDYLSNTITEMKFEKNYQYEELLIFLGLKEKSEVPEIVDKILDRLNKSERFPLVWFERLYLFTDDFYEFMFEKLTNLVELFPTLNSMNIFMGEGLNESTTKTYQLSMCKGSYERTFPLLYAVLSYKSGATSFFDWMRTLRNLILNTDIRKEDLPSILDSITRFGELCEEQNVYQVLSEAKGDDLLKGFNKQQIEEEIVKSQNLNYYKDMVNFENGRFFRGCIGIIFRLLSNKEGNDGLSDSNFHSYSCILLELFDGIKGGVSVKFDDERYLLRRALMTYKPYKFGLPKSNCWSFCGDFSEWREYVKSSKSNIGSLQQMMKHLLVPAFNEGKNLENVIYEHVESISRNYDQDILINDNLTYRFHFIHHPGVWQYMETKRCKWEKSNNYDIVLKKSDSNNSNRIELRTLGLYLDYRHNQAFKSDRVGWKVANWARENSCVYFYRNIHNNDNIVEIKIDLYFYDDAGNRKNENYYSFDLFANIDHPNPESLEEAKKYAADDYNLNIKLFTSIIPEYMNLFTRKESGRLHSNQLYSRQDVKEVLKNIMLKISQVVDGTPLGN